MAPYRSITELERLIAPHDQHVQKLDTCRNAFDVKITHLNCHCWTIRIHKPLHTADDMPFGTFRIDLDELWVQVAGGAVIVQGDGRDVDPVFQGMGSILLTQPRSEGAVEGGETSAE